MTKPPNTSTTASVGQVKAEHLFAPVAIDIGGSFAKIVYFRLPDPPSLPDFCKRHDAPFLPHLRYDYSTEPVASPTESPLSHVMASSSTYDDHVIESVVSPDTSIDDTTSPVAHLSSVRRLGRRPSVAGDLERLGPECDDPLGEDVTPVTSTKLGGQLAFIKFESSRVCDFISFLKDHEIISRYEKAEAQRRAQVKKCGISVNQENSEVLCNGGDSASLGANGCNEEGWQSKNGAKDSRGGRHSLSRVNATGGGSYKYATIINERLGIELRKLPEMATIIRGLNFLCATCKEEVFTYHFETNEKKFVDLSGEGSLYPYLLANVGSGVSFLKVTGPDTFERVSGTSLGGGTFWGLCRLLAGGVSFDEILEKIDHEGDNTKVDLLVSDIYGDADEDSERYSSLGLDPKLIASSFGKVATSMVEDVSELNPLDVIKSLLFTTTNNIAQIAYLNARIHGLRRIFLAGGFVRNNAYVWQRFSYAIDFWSSGEMNALFLRHDGFLGALGALITDEEKQ